MSVELDDVAFAYPSADKVSLASLEEVATLDTRGGEEVIHAVSFRAEPGQLVALVGSSGAGKSTIAQLLPRLYDVDAGAVRLGGVDVRDLSVRLDPRRPSAWSRRTDTCSTSRSGRTCCSPAPTPTEDELWDALERARLGDLVRVAARRARTRWSASAATGSPAASGSG